MHLNKWRPQGRIVEVVVIEALEVQLTLKFEWTRLPLKAEPISDAYRSHQHFAQAMQGFAIGGP